MPSTDVVLNFIASTDDANSKVDQLITNVGRLAGVGAAAGVFGEFTAASMSFQDAMARIQTAYNAVDFSPGTARYEQAQQTILRMSTTLATSFEDLAQTYGQGARFIDEFGNRLSPSKVDEYTEAVTRLAKVSSDQLDPETIGKYVETFAKLTDMTNFGGIASAVSALSGVHNLGEGPLLQSAVGIEQVGAPLGVSQAQALGLANFLVDRGATPGMGGGGRGTAQSIGRLLLGMNTAAETALNPEEQYSAVQRQRTAQERVDDLQTQLREEQARAAQMYGQHGLKRQYARNPVEVMAMNDRIAKLQRELADAQENQAHLAEGGNAKGFNISAMAQTAGMDLTEFAQLTQSDPISAILAFATGLHELNPEGRTQALKRSGVSANIQTMRTLEMLSTAPDVARQQIAMAQGQIDTNKFLNPATGQYEPITGVSGDLLTRSNTVLATTSNKITDAANAARGAAAAAGEGPRQMIDAATTQLLDEYHKNSEAVDRLNNTLTSNPLIGTIATGVVAGATAIIPQVIAAALVRGGAGVAGDAIGTGAAATGAAGAGGAGVAGALATTAAVGVAALTPFALAEMWKEQNPDANFVPVDQTGQAYAQRHPIGAIPAVSSPQKVEVNGLTFNVPAVQTTDWNEMKDAVLNFVGQHLSMAVNAALSSQPVSSVVGGNLNVSGQGPR